MKLAQRLTQGPLIFDGATGTMLQSLGLPAGSAPEVWCLEKPELVRKVHAQFVDAGAQVLETNTFGATPIRLSHYGLDCRAREINLSAVALAREASQGKALVAASMGPLGVLVQPLGPLPFREAYNQFSQQAKAFYEAKPDFIIIETIADLNEMRAALLACKDHAPGIKIIAQMTLDSTARSFTGTGPKTAGIVMQSLGADIMGFNCSVGPAQLVDAVKRVSKVARIPISVQPNAGMPQLINGKTVFPMGAEEFAGYGPRLIEAGASVIGGCCGTTPQHIKLLRNAVQGMKPNWGRGDVSGALSLTSRTAPLIFTEKNLPIVVGERLNPTGKKALAKDILAGTYSLVRREAKKQVNAGATVLDVNVGVPLIDEETAMAQTVLAVQEAVTVPICIDSASPKAIEAGLLSCVGKAVVNSFSLEEGRAEAILPLVKRYGAAVIGLTIDNRGVPHTVKERVLIAKRLVEAVKQYGIPPTDLIIDPLALTAGAQQAQAIETLKAISVLRHELGFVTSLGVSNISFGLPNRSFLNAAFLAMALGAGLDMAIINPLDEAIMDTVRAARVFLNRDENAKAYIFAAGRKTDEPPSRENNKPSQEKDLGQRLYQAVLEGDSSEIAHLVGASLSRGLSPMEILNRFLIPAIEETGRLFGAGIYFLPQLIQSSGAMKLAFDILKPELAKAKEGQPSSGVIIVATVQGDIHDIGKNLVSVLLENHGFDVRDLGKDVKPETLLEEARRLKADIVCLSALMTTTMPKMKEVIDLFREEGLDCPVMVGGAATTKSFADEIGASGYGRDAQEAIFVAKAIMANKRGRTI